MNNNILYIICFVLISCNLDTRNDALRISFFEQEGDLQFPRKVTISKYDENILNGEYLLLANIEKLDIEDFLYKNKGFKVFNDSVIGNGINFSQDDLDLVEFELLFELDEGYIPRDKTTYIYRINSQFGKKIFVLNINSGTFFLYVEK